MKAYRVMVMRTDTYYDYVEVEASGEQAAMEIVDDMLADEGWDSVFDGEGNYQDCDYWVADVEEV